MRASILAATALVACKGVEPAPKDLDALFHFFWQTYEEGDDALLAEGVRSLHEVVRAGRLDEVMDGSISDLSKDEAAIVGVDGRNPRHAAGLYLVRVFECDLEDLQEILAARDQDDQYPDAYESYERTYTSDAEAFAAHETATLTWEVEYRASVMGNEYESTILGGLRYLEARGEEETPWGPVLFARTWMPREADFENDGWSLDQDYQIEVFYERDSGTILHAYAIWREGDFGSWGDMDDESIQRIVLNNLADWDDQTESLCR